MHTEKLFELTYILLDKKSITASEAAEHFEVSTRTIYRWVDALNEAGIPLYTSKGKGGGIFISEKYALDKTLFTESEKQEILASLQALKGLSGGNIFSKNEISESAITKIKSMSETVSNEDKASGNTDWILVDFDPWSSKGKEVQGLFEKIKKAILGGNNIEFDYYSMNGESRGRKISPWKLVFKSQAWYLYGWCFEKKNARFFKLSRIINLKILSGKNENWHAPEEWEENTFVDNANPPKMMKVVLQINELFMPMLLDEYKAKNVKKIGEDLFRVEVSLPDVYWIDGFLLSFGEAVEVMEPVYLRNRIKDRIEDIRELYKKKYV